MQVWREKKQQEEKRQERMEEVELEAFQRRDNRKKLFEEEKYGEERKQGYVFNAALVKRLDEPERRKDEVLRGPKGYKLKEEAKRKLCAKIILRILIGCLIIILVACVWGCWALFTSERISMKYCN